MSNEIDYDKEFAAIEKKNKGWSSLVVLLNLIRYRQLPESTVRTLFEKHVKKSDYTPTQKQTTFDYCMNETQKEPKNTSKKAL